MEVRSRVAAAAAAVIPFHCVICFDEFNLKDRPPMVLPCGHTYVCLPCSKRLKRCMECREPLFLNLNNVNKTPQRPNNSYPQRHRYANNSPQTPSTPPQPLHSSQTSHSPPKTIPLPIPKNVVLISMIEAAERQSSFKAQESEHGETSSTFPEDESEVEEEEAEDEDQFDLNRIISGMATLNGPCGTYVVRESSGLAVVPTDPRKRSNSNFNGEEKKQETIDLGLPEPFALLAGQTVQVVEFDEGVAKLARDAGYIVANSSQLVKVGGPLDESCRIEGILNTVASRGRDLQQELDENHKIEENLREQLKSSMKSEPNHKIITDPPKPDDIFIEDGDCGDPADDNEQQPHPTTPKTTAELSQPILHTPERFSSAIDFFIGPTASGGLDACVNLPTFQQGRLVPGSPVSIDNADLHRPQLPTYRRSTSSENLNQLVLGCGTTFLGETTHLFSYSGSEDDENRYSQNGQANRDDLGAPDITRNRSGSESDSPRYQYVTPTQTSSFDTVDFRTGLSGHRALTSAKKGTGPAPRGQVRMMSEHRGIARIRPLPRDSPTMPSMVSGFMPLNWNGGGSS